MVNHCVGGYTTCGISRSSLSSETIWTLNYSRMAIKKQFLRSRMNNHNLSLFLYILAFGAVKSKLFMSPLRPKERWAVRLGGCATMRLKWKQGLISKCSRPAQGCLTVGRNAVGLAPVSTQSTSPLCH
ncbi:hypothetical protein PoMZ_12387 [Pyricularia oryzae]|uniref:Uncharacterized protein n=1 Tax=Pyricularia oryzae TaxID=318829 RepID=A0A4P7NSJ4_PYROR|nr:hypothetical protein PoMZ_12387 [Pyricularia oryzae]